MTNPPRILDIAREMIAARNDVEALLAIGYANSARVASDDYHATVDWLRARLQQL